MERKRVTKAVADLAWKACGTAALKCSSAVSDPVEICKEQAAAACCEVRESGPSVN